MSGSLRTRRSHAATRGYCPGERVGKPDGWLVLAAATKEVEHHHDG